MNNQDNNNFNNMYGQNNNDIFNNGMLQSSQQPQNYDSQYQQFSNQDIKPNLYAPDPYMEQISQQDVEQVDEDDKRGGGLFSFLFALLLLIVSVAFLLNTLNIVDLKELANKYIPIGNNSEKKDEVDSNDKSDNNLDDSNDENNSSDNKIDSKEESNQEGQENQNNDEQITNNENNLAEQNKQLETNEVNNN